MTGSNYKSIQEPTVRQDHKFLIERTIEKRTAMFAINE